MTLDNNEVVKTVIDNLAMYTAEVTDNDIEEMLNLVATINNQIKYKSIHCVTKGEFYRIKKHLLTWYMLSHPQNCEFLCMQKPLFGKSKFAKLVVTSPNGKRLKLHCESSNILESSFVEMRTKETCPLDNENCECETDNLDSNWQLLRSKCESLNWFFLSYLDWNHWRIETMKQYFSIENWDKQFVNPPKKPFSNKIWFAERNKTYKKIARLNIGAIMQGLPVCVDGKPCDHVFNTNIKP